MARKLNKNLVGALTFAGMVLLSVAGFVLLANLPGRDPKTYEEEAKKLEADGEFKKAMETYLRAYKRDPVQNPEYLVSAAHCALEEGGIGDARQLIKQARLRDTRLKSAARLSSEMEFEIGQQFGGKLQWKTVLTEAELLQELEGESAPVQKAIGMAHLGMADDDPSYAEKGEKALRRALELDPTNLEVARSLMTRLWIAARQKMEAGDRSGGDELERQRAEMLATSISKAEAAGNTDGVSDLRQLQANFEIVNGDLDKGLADLEELASKETKRADCHILLGNVYAGLVRPLGRSELEEVSQEAMAKAAAAYERAVEIDPKNGTGHRMLALVNRRLADRSSDEKKKSELRDKEKQTYLAALEQIPRRKHFRAFADNMFRVEFISELFMRDIENAREAPEEDRTKLLASAESWVSKLRDEIGPEELEVRMLKAYLLNAKNQFVEATREAEAANQMPQASGRFPLQRLLAELYIRGQQWGNARKALEGAYRLQPDSPLICIWMGQVLLQLNDPAGALSFVRPTGPPTLRDYLSTQTTAIQLAMEAYRQLGEYEKAEQLSKQLGSGSPEDEVREGILAAAQQEYAKAEQKAQAVLAKEPTNQRAIRLLLQTYQLTNRAAEASELIRSLREKHPDDREIQRLELMSMEEPDESKRDQKVIEFLNQDPDPYVRAISLADFCASRSKFEDAVRHMDAAEGLKPESPEVAERQLRLAIQLKDWDRGQKYAELIQAKNLDGTGGKLASGRLLMAKGELQQAIDKLMSGMEDFPSNSIGWTYLAEAYLAANRVGDAKNVLSSRALVIDPTNGFASRMLATIAVREGDEAGEEKYVGIALRVLPDDPWLNRRQQIIQERKNPGQGISAREKVRKDKPEDLENLVLLARLYADPAVADYEKAAETYRAALKASKNNVDLAREAAGFFAREEVNRPAEGEELLQGLLRDQTDDPQKALMAVYLGQFYENQKILATADRQFRLAVNLDPSSVEILVMAAEFYTRIGRFRDALEYYRRVLKQPDASKDDRDKTARERIIGLLLQVNELAEAKKEIDQYVQQYPDDPEGLIYEGAYHRMGGDIQKAKEAFDAHLQRNPDSAVALWQRGQLYLLMGRYALAIDDLKRARAFNQYGFAYQHRIALAEAYLGAHRDEEAISELKGLLVERPDEAVIAEALIDIYTRVRPVRFSDAETLLYTYMRKDPKNPRWPTMLGRLGELIQKPELAVQGYEKAAEVSRYQPELINTLFRTYRVANRHRAIIDYATMKLSSRLLDTMPIALSTLAWAYWQAGEQQKAYDSFERAISASAGEFFALNSVVADMVLVLGKEEALKQIKGKAEGDPQNIEKQKTYAHLLQMNGKNEEGTEVCQRIERMATNDEDMVFALLGQGMLLEVQQKWEAAREKYEAVLKIDPNHAIALNNLAFLLGETMKRPAEALPYAEQAYRQDRRGPDVLDTYGWILALNQRFGEATGMLLRALEIDRRHLASAYHLGLVHKMHGEREEALSRLKMAKAAAEEKGDTVYLPKILEALADLDKAKG